MTRTRCRLHFYESRYSAAGAAFFKWAKERDLAIEFDATAMNGAAVQEMLPDEWCSSGLEQSSSAMDKLEEKNFDGAAAMLIGASKCFLRAGPGQSKIELLRKATLGADFAMRLQAMDEHRAVSKKEGEKKACKKGKAGAKKQAEQKPSDQRQELGHYMVLGQQKAEKQAKTDLTKESVPLVRLKEGAQKPQSERITELLPFELIGGDDQPFDLDSPKHLDSNASLLAHAGLFDDAVTLFSLVAKHRAGAAADEQRSARQQFEHECTTALVGRLQELSKKQERGQGDVDLD
jgi:hypothetical protein